MGHMVSVRFHEGGSLRADSAYAYGDSGTDVDGASHA